MEFLIMRNKRQVEELCVLLKARRLPYKVALQDIFPERSLDANAYYWGIVLKAVSDHTGHTQEECHEAFKQMFLCMYDLAFNPVTKAVEWTFGVGSTTELNTREIWDYITHVRVFAEIELHLTIPLPNEVFINEIIFEAEL